MADAEPRADDARSGWGENMSAEWIAISNELAEATEKARTYTVAVHAEPRGSSSGVVWRPGIIVTAEHALRRDEDIQVTLASGRVVSTKLVGRDPLTDLAVLNCADTLAAAPLGHSENLKVGHLTLTVGQTRASGAVAALGFVSLATNERRMWGGLTLAPYVRLDVALQRISVGGAVVGGNGQVVGVASTKFSRVGALVLPVTTVNRVVDALLEKGHVPRGYLGVGLQPVRLPESLRESLQRQGSRAAIVLEVEPDGPAHKAGVVIGDILLALNGTPVMRLEDVQASLGVENIGKTVHAQFLRGGAPRDVDLVVAEHKNAG
jgi:S1-C subfamily serine protease